MDIWFVNLAGLGLIAAIIWYFFLSRREEQAEAAAVGSAQEIQVTVKGGYIPDTLVARPGVPLRIHFRREETSSCSEEVVFPDFGIRRALPAFETTVVEIPAGPAGTYAFACGMDMMHGRIVVKGTAAESQDRPAPVTVAMPAREMAVDPICGMSVDPSRAAGVSVRDGKKFYFCGLGCKKRFDSGGGPAPHGALEQRVTFAVRRKS